MITNAERPCDRWTRERAAAVCVHVCGPRFCALIPAEPSARAGACKQSVQKRGPAFEDLAFLERARGYVRRDLTRHLGGRRAARGLHE